MFSIVRVFLNGIFLLIEKKIQLKDAYRYTRYFYLIPSNNCTIQCFEMYTMEKKMYEHILKWTKIAHGKQKKNKKKQELQKVVNMWNDGCLTLELWWRE